ncbi:DUF3306 domain-containing protein [Cupriavidus neocaledonicus]|uniref:DUF3306 domain-containing protein n=1 Tax=Cupriavidus neocaledonicus TaxID=1040979 RepID=A0A375H949_9BURK|nr:DUF3306 domain-containing protein [Cupriavidus neocaledonicus]SOZ35809.1 conserved hypothetical protein [Cupriavidus neocaledonicus]SPD47775.1 conserved protein of unknown function [Cupriavidus neocaledonicus]
MSESSFLSRWSRRKAAVREGVAVPAEPPQPPQPRQPESGPVPATVEAAAEAPRDPPPTLADVAALRPGDEIARFVARGVDESVKRAALKTLFADPHFNVMDGLDIYIDDYSKPDPIPAEILRQLRQAQTLGLFEPTDEERAAAAAAARVSEPEQVPPAAQTDAQQEPHQAGAATGEGADAPPVQADAPAGAETPPPHASQSEQQGQQDPHARPDKRA